MAEIRLIAVDLDGTLLTRQRTPHPESAAALRQAQSEGITVVLASGRTIATIRPIAAEIGIRGPIVSCNGAFVADPDGQPLFEARLEPAHIAHLIAYAESRALHTHVYSGEDIYMSGENEFAAEYRRRTNVTKTSVLPYAELAQLPAAKVLFFDHAPVIERIEAEISPWSRQHTNTIRSESEYIEFLPLGVSKATGLDALAKSLNLHPRQIAAVGDYFNDQTMIEYAGLSGVMADAPEDLKKIADFVLPSNDEGGVATFIKHILNLKQVL